MKLFSGFRRLTLMAVAMLAAVGFSASADSLWGTPGASLVGTSGFSILEQNGEANLSSSFKLEIYNLGSHVGFRLLNNAATPGNVVIGRIFFYDGHLIQAGTIDSAAPPAYTISLNPNGNLPGFDPGPGGTKNVTLVELADPTSGSPPGIGEGQHLDIKFDLKDGVTYQDVLDDLTNVQPATAGSFYIGFHLQNVGATGQQSQSYLAGPPGGPTPSPVPLPGVASAGLGLLAGLGAMRRKRK